MRSPFSPLHLLLFILALAFLVALVQVGAITIAFDKLGLSAGSGFLLLFGSLFGSAINVPLFSIQTQQPPSAEQIRLFYGLLRLPPSEVTDRTVIAVNVGGCVIPVTFSLYLLVHNSLNLGLVILGVCLVAAIAYTVSRPIRGVGIGMPVFIAPISAALIALLLDPHESAPMAYICGTLGVLIGADLFRVGNIRQMGTPFASIGGAGTFDGIFITGIVAVLLA
jgi:uncharacterized membrane protein